MSTRIYGTSDDLIEIEGELTGEVGYGRDGERGALIIVSDGTLLEVKYGKDDKAIWEVKLLERGELFHHIQPCTNEEAKIYSDVAHFKSGVRWAYAAKDEWERVR